MASQSSDAVVTSPQKKDEEMNINQFDAVVVGAGPAGSIAALTLARRGARVALIDKARFPRDKACGDLIGPRGVGLLSKLGVRVEATRMVRDLRVIGFGATKSAYGAKLLVTPSSAKAHHAFNL
jgi:2-polyprenyl-6-methoxyphenol hydroxylase-like FAD-dependent oxidoreductase